MFDPLDESNICGYVHTDQNSTNDDKTTLLIVKKSQLSPTTRTLIFSVAMFNIFAQYLYFTVPIPFLANEIIEVR